MSPSPSPPVIVLDGHRWHLDGYERQGDHVVAVLVRWALVDGRRVEVVRYERMRVRP